MMKCSSGPKSVQLPLQDDGRSDPMIQHTAILDFNEGNIRTNPMQILKSDVVSTFDGPGLATCEIRQRRSIREDDAERYPANPTRIILSKSVAKWAQGVDALRTELARSSS